MPAIAEHTSNNAVKLLLPADSGAGKTGALSSLVDAGLNVRILDFDNGVSVLSGYVKDKSKLANVHFIPLKDQMSLVASRVGVKKASAFQEAMDALDGGPKAAKLWGADFGPVTSWTPRDVLVLDTLGMAGRASLQMVMQLNGKGHAQPELQHYGTAMDNIEKLIAILTSESVPCHVIVNTHLTNIEGSPKLYPEALGSKLSPKIGRYFDNMITLSISRGADANAGATRSFKTVKDGLLACKTARPLAETYPIATGLKDIFLGLTGKKDLLEGLS